MPTTTVVPPTTSRPPYLAAPQFSPVNPPAQGTRVHWTVTHGVTEIDAVGIAYTPAKLHSDGIHVPAEYRDLVPVLYEGTIVWVSPYRLRRAPAPVTR